MFENIFGNVKEDKFSKYEACYRSIFVFNVLFKSETCKFVYTLFTVLMFLHVHITLSQDLFSAKSRFMSFV